MNAVSKFHAFWYQARAVVPAPASDWFNFSSTLLSLILSIISFIHSFKIQGQFKIETKLTTKSKMNKHKEEEEEMDEVKEKCEMLKGCSLTYSLVIPARMASRTLPSFIHGYLFN